MMICSVLVFYLHFVVLTKMKEILTTFLSAIRAVSAIVRYNMTSRRLYCCFHISEPAKYSFHQINLSEIHQIRFSFFISNGKCRQLLHFHFKNWLSFLQMIFYKCLLSFSNRCSLFFFCEEITIIVFFFFLLVFAQLNCRRWFDEYWKKKK